MIRVQFRGSSPHPRRIRDPAGAVTGGTSGALFANPESPGNRRIGGRSRSIRNTGIKEKKHGWISARTGRSRACGSVRADRRADSDELSRSSPPSAARFSTGGWGRQPLRDNDPGCNARVLCSFARIPPPFSNSECLAAEGDHRQGRSPRCRYRAGTLMFRTLIQPARRCVVFFTPRLPPRPASPSAAATGSATPRRRKNCG